MKTLRDKQVPGIHAAEDDLFHANRWTDGQTVVTKLIAAFHDFTTSPQKKMLAALLLTLIMRVVTSRLHSTCI